MGDRERMEESMKTFYRIGVEDDAVGLWYDKNGQFTGLIHGMQLQCSGLQMPYDEELVGYLSATETLEELYAWFPQEEIRYLQTIGYRIHKYNVHEYKYYEKYKHLVINKETSTKSGIYVL